MLGYYNYTVILTYFGAAVGFTGIGFILNGDLKAALFCLMISGFCDMFDGKIAATRKRTAEEKAFGIQIDSLSDLLCFGVLPALIVYSLLPQTALRILFCSIYVLCALIRLAFFNVDEAKRQVDTDGCRKLYRGLPVTTAALLFPVIIVLCKVLHLPTAVIALCAMLLTGIAFLCPFRLQKPALAGKVVLILLGIAALLGLIFWGC